MSAPPPRARGEPLLRHAAATVHGRFLVRPPAGGAPAPWLVGFHGYGQSAETFFEPLASVPRSDRWLVAAVQALHPFYAGRANEVVANWMTRQDRELAIADNVAYVDAVLDQLEREFGPPCALVFAGFSQGVAMAYRAGLLGRRPCDAIVAAGGDVPPELRDAPPRPWPRLLMATGTGDAFYPPAQLEAEAALLRARRPDVATHVFAGGHEWGAAVVQAVGELLADVEREVAPRGRG